MNEISSAPPRKVWLSESRFSPKSRSLGTLSELHEKCRKQGKVSVYSLGKILITALIFTERKLLNGITWRFTTNFT